METAIPPFSRGFVPTSFLVPVKTAAPPSTAPPSQQQRAGAGAASGRLNQPIASSKALTVSRSSDWDNDSQRSFDSQPPPPQPRKSNSGPASSKPSSVRRLSDPRLAHQLLNVLAIHPPEDHVGGVAKFTGGTHQSEYQHLLAQHDRQFQQVMHQRHAQFKSLDDTASELLRRIEATKQKSSEISAHLLDITGVIEGERRKWKEKLNEQVNVYLSPTFKCE